MHPRRAERVLEWRSVRGRWLLPGALYWTGALEGPAVPGWDCAKADWTCDGGSTIGISAYAAALVTTTIARPNTDHAANTGAAEPARWLAG